MKSTAPRLIAETAVSILPWPEKMMTGSSGSRALIASSTSSPSIGEPCSQTSSRTRLGRRWSTASSAEVLSPAVRHSYPSSSSTPATSSRMSRSSSTIRISSAIGSPFSFGCFGRALALGEGIARKIEGHHRAAALGRSEGHFAAMFLDDLLDDGEAETGALLARGHVGLGDPLAVLRQTDPVVGDRDRDALPLAA